MTNRKGVGSLYFWKLAVIVVLVFGCMHMIGFRQYTSVWAGTQSEGSEGTVAGFCYILLYLSTIICVPILFLTDFMLWILQICKEDPRQ